jgi:hypothetical protein
MLGCGPRPHDVGDASRRMHRMTVVACARVRAHTVHDRSGKQTLTRRLTLARHTGGRTTEAGWHTCHPHTTTHNTHTAERAERSAVEHSGYAAQRPCLESVHRLTTRSTVRPAVQRAARRPFGRKVRPMLNPFDVNCRWSLKASDRDRLPPYRYRPLPYFQCTTTQ